MSEWIYDRNGNASAILNRDCIRSDSAATSEISSRCDKTPFLSLYRILIGTRSPCPPENISMGLRTPADPRLRTWV